MNRFVVLQHEVAGSQLQRTPQTHFDWMFEAGGSLRSFATEVIDSFERLIDVDAQLLSDHRIEYLDFEGTVSGDRGRVRRVISGTYVSSRSSDDRFEAVISWIESEQQRSAQLTVYRSFTTGLPGGEGPRPWRLMLAPC